MFSLIFSRLRRIIADFTRTHLVADEKDLWPGKDPVDLELMELEIKRRESGLTA